MLLERITDLWFPDGNVIIQAENSLFRVYQGFLSARSEVLNDMFMFPQPEKAETMDGTPLVSFQDRADDMKYFLRAVFHSGYFEPAPSKVTCPVVLAVLRLSHKYNVAYLRRRALQHLAIFYPTTVDSFVAFTAAMWSSLFMEFCGDAYDYKSVHFACAEVTCEVNALWALPAILYWCTAYSDVDDLLDGVREKAKTVSNSRECQETDSSVSESDSPPLMIRLPRDFPRRCTKLKAISMTSPLLITEFMTARTTATSFSNCISPKKCQAFRYKIFVTSISASQDGPNIFKFQNAQCWGQFEKKLCAQCYREFSAVYSDGRIRFWRSLPEELGLPSWDDLNKMKTDDLTDPGG